MKINFFDKLFFPAFIKKLKTYFFDILIIFKNLSKYIKSNFLVKKIIFFFQKKSYPNTHLILSLFQKQTNLFLVNLQFFFNVVHCLVPVTVTLGTSLSSLPNDNKSTTNHFPPNFPRKEWTRGLLRFLLLTSYN